MVPLSTIAPALTLPANIVAEATGPSGAVVAYNAVAGQFIFNWQTPKTAGRCYSVTVTTQDGSAITAFFKLK